MINLQEITVLNDREHNPKWPQTLDLLQKIETFKSQRRPCWK